MTFQLDVNEQSIIFTFHPLIVPCIRAIQKVKICEKDCIFSLV